MLLQISLIGKAQRIYASLSIDECGDYDIMKKEILKGYELVPEAYRQKFRNCARGHGESYVEFANQKVNLLHRWCDATDVKGDYEKFRQIILIEEFLKDLPEKLKIFLNEKKASTVHQLAKMADEYAVTHKGNRERESEPQPVLSQRSPHSSSRNGSSNQCRSKTLGEEERVNFERPRFQRERRNDPPRCFRCREIGHISAQCPIWRDARAVRSMPMKTAGTVVRAGYNKSFQPYVSDGQIANVDDTGTRKINVLRDTGATQTLIERKMLPRGRNSYTGKSVAVRGIENRILIAPIHKIRLNCKWRSGIIDVAVVERIPMEKISLLLGNDCGSPPKMDEVPKGRRRRKRRRNKANSKSLIENKSDFSGATSRSWRDKPQEIKGRDINVSKT